MTHSPVILSQLKAALMKQHFLCSLSQMILKRRNKIIMFQSLSILVLGTGVKVVLSAYISQGKR